MLPKIISLISLVALSGWMAYFIVGGLPLLILRHDHAQDARFIRGFFDVHYLVLIIIALVGALSAVLSGRSLLASTIGGIGLIAFIARRIFLARMDHIRTTVAIMDGPAVKQFRRLQVTGIGLSVFMLVGFFSVLSTSSANIMSCYNTPPGCEGENCRVQCSLL